MPNYFYTDASGQKQGPVSGSKIKELAKTGLIVPETTIEAKDGKTFLANKITQTVKASPYFPLSFCIFCF